MLKTLLAVCLMAFNALAFGASANVAAAATLRPALDELLPAFSKATGHTVKVAYGSSGNFYSQIRQGAPFDLFMSADMEFPEKLVKEKFALPPVLPYAEGRIVLMVPNTSAVKLDETLADLPLALKEGRLNRFAIANPAVAPYGMRAQEVLQHHGLWPQLQAHLVQGENIGQASQFVTTGSAQAGLIAYSLALAPEVASRTRFVLIPKHTHKPLVQGLVLMPNRNPAALALVDYLKTGPARAVLKKHGYDEPSQP